MLKLEIRLDYKGNRGFRLLNIYERLNNGEIINKSELADAYNVSEKTIQRDIDDLRAYLCETHFDDGEAVIKYSKSKNGYYLSKFSRDWLSGQEVLAICKVLLESRAFRKEELNDFLSKLTAQVLPEEQKQIDRLIANERFYYVPPKHNKNILSQIWEVANYIVKNTIISFAYNRKDGVKKDRLVKPVAVMFSEYYFYLIAFMADDSKDYPTIFRIDRMENIKGTSDKFSIPYKDKFNDGEFRKRVQFMYSGELRKVTFEFSGESLEAVLDRLPTAEVIGKKDGVYTIRAEVYGNGIDMWLKSQGEKVKVIKE